MKRIFGGSDSPAQDAKAAAKQQAEFSELHAKRRRAMLEAALLSAKDGKDERRRRVEQELEPQPPAPAADAR